LMGALLLGVYQACPVPRWAPCVVMWRGGCFEGRPRVPCGGVWCVLLCLRVLSVCVCVCVCQCVVRERLRAAASRCNHYPPKGSLA